MSAHFIRENLQGKERKKRKEKLVDSAANPPISPILIMVDPKSVLNLAGFLLYLVMLLAQAPN